MIGNPLLLGPEGYQISRSVRLRSSASAYLTRTPSSTTNRRTWTWSGWRKRGTLGGDQTFFEAQNGTTFNRIGVDGNINFYCNGGTSAVATTFNVASSAVIRDPSAWYHFVVSFDTTQATAANRVRLYINGVQVSSFASASYPNQNTDWSWNTSGAAHNIGRYVDSSYGAGGYFDGYVAEDIFIDGQALTPSSFGETDAVTGVWKPKKYTGTYGTNGFFLDYRDNSAATANGIGKDRSGNNNDWTPNNISVTTGSTYDSMLDVPTPWADGGNGRGNYAVLNPVFTLSSGATVSAGNLNILGASASAYGSPATMLLTSGKWYFEVTAGTVASRYPVVGVQTEATAFLSSGFPGGYTANGFGYGSDGNKFVNNGPATAFGSTFTSGDVIGVAIDIDAGKVWVAKNNTWQASGDPAAGTNAAYTTTAGTSLYPCVGTYNGAGTHSVNFGQRPLTYSPPSGFKALNTQNLPTPTILKGASYFDVSTWTGNGSARSITNSGSMQPDLVWVKSRTQAIAHRLIDAVRGAGNTLASNLTNAEFSDPQGVTSFNSNGFGIGTDTSYNQSSDTYVGWQWKEGATQGFDIVTYTGTGANRTVAHSLGVAPKMIIFKARDSGNNWIVYHASLSLNPGAYLYLNLTLAQDNGISVLNQTNPTSSVFTVGTNVMTNGSGGSYVAYLFSEVAGFSKFGSYTGNGSSDGPFVFCGFRPRWVMSKRTDSTGSWLVVDSARNTYNVVNGYLVPNTSDAEGSATWGDFTSNGFKLRGTTHNGSGESYIYAAFAETAFRYSLAR